MILFEKIFGKKRQIDKLVQQAQQNSYRASINENSGYNNGGYSHGYRGAAKSVEKLATSLGENDPNYILAQRKGIERASRLIQSKEGYKGDLSYHYRSGRSVNSSVDQNGSSMDMKDTKRYENIVKDDVKRLMEKALNPQGKRLDVYLHQEREKRQAMNNSKDSQGRSEWKGLLAKKSDYSHPFENNNGRGYSPERSQRSYRQGRSPVATKDLANIDIAYLLRK